MSFPTIASLRLPITTTEEEGFCAELFFKMCLPLEVGVEYIKDMQSKKTRTFKKAECFSKDTPKFVKPQLR